MKDAILVDRHQADLFYALQTLFERRLGYRLYTPVGHDWWDAGYWQFGAVFGDDRLARQYLEIGSQWQPSPSEGVFLTTDPCHTDRFIPGVTLDKARSMNWHAVVATVQENQSGFRRFADEVDAAYLCQVGNTRQQIDWSLDPICLNSTSDVALTGRGVRIGQEFDTARTFRYREPEPSARERVASFVNLLPLIPDAWASFQDLQVRLTGWRFRSFGHHCPDGILQPVEAIADEMADTGWAYHDKVTGDGFGHIIHNWAAVGRPLVGHARYYQGQRAEVFWQDGVTCIDLDLHSSDEAAEIMRTMPWEQYVAMSRAIRATLEANVDWAGDAERVRALLS